MARAVGTRTALILQAFLGSVLVLASASVSFAQQGSAVLTGQVRDAASGKPVVDAVVTVRSPALQGEELAVTDETGAYRIPGLAPGLYVLRIESERFKVYVRSELDLHADTTIRLNASLLPEAIQGEEVVVVGRTPTVDVGSSATGMNITSDFTLRVPLVAPGSKGSAARSFEAVGDVVPGAQVDPFGVSVFGSSSPENGYLLDGLSVGNPATGVLGTPLSIEFIKEVSVLSGGYMPEYGRSTGGIFNAVTKSGSNEYHGSIFTAWAPGGLQGERKSVLSRGQTVLTQPNLAYMGDLGGEVGGPIVRDKLWFYLGFDWARTAYDIDRSLYRTLLDETGSPRVNARGEPLTESIAGTRQRYEAQQDMFQAIGKLTWAVNRENRLTLSVNGVYPTAGRAGQFGIHPITGLPEAGTENVPPFSAPINGPYSAFAHRYPASSTNALVRWSSELDGQRTVLDTWVGLHHETGGRLPSDGSRVGSLNGLAGVSNVVSYVPRSITDFRAFEPRLGTQCDAPADNPMAVPCPVSEYHVGGPEYIEEQKLSRVQGRSMLTHLFRALGHHVLKVGVDLEYQHYHHVKAYSGERDFAEVEPGVYLDGRVYGYLKGPDDPVVLRSMTNDTQSIAAGAFIQDSWSIADRVTLNLGLRYDAQIMYAADGERALTLPNQWSPRAGLIWDPTYEGHAKLFVNFARYYESVPLVMLDRYLSGEPFLFAYRDGAQCNPLDPGMQRAECLQPGVIIPQGTAPNADYIVSGAGTTPIDPKIKAPSTDELVLGGEYEIVRDGRIGLTYTKRWLNRTIEDMSLDEAQTLFFGNPGYGIARDFPKATRKYDAVTLQFTKLFSGRWLAQASYTLSFLRGNYGGLYRAEDRQLDPHQSSDFDLAALAVNRTGYLPGDRRHFIKLFTAYEVPIGKVMLLTPGAAFRAHSGEPTNYLGAHPLYGPDQVYILGRGAGERLPWSYSADLRLAFGIKVGKTRTLSATMDVFNVFNFQRAIARDQRYTASSVSAVRSGGIANLTNDDGTPFDPSGRNPNFGRPTAYQPPRVFRFGLKGTF